MSQKIIDKVILKAPFNSKVFVLVTWILLQL